MVAERVPYLQASTTSDGADWIGCDAVARRSGRGSAAVVRGTARDSAPTTTPSPRRCSPRRTRSASPGTRSPRTRSVSRSPTSRPSRCRAHRQAATVGGGVPRTPTTSEPDAHCAGGGAHRRAPRSVRRFGARAVPGRRTQPWGNVAAASRGHVPCGRVERRRPPIARARPGDGFFAAAEPTFDGLGNFTVVEHDGREGWYWDRTSCCLWFRTPDGRVVRQLQPDRAGRRCSSAAEIIDPPVSPGVAEGQCIVDDVLAAAPIPPPGGMIDFSSM